MFENGCSLVRADFHLHTNKDKEFKYDGDENSFAKNYVAVLKQHNIGVGVITNHNKFDLGEYKAIRKAAAKDDIFILPGVELSVKEGSNGVHTLIVFKPEDWIGNGENHIDSFLSSVFLGINNRENENTRCNVDIPTLIRQLNGLDKEYFIIFAHIEQKSGLLKECQGGLIESLACKTEFRERVLGMQKLRTRDNVEKLRQWLGYEVAFIEGSDPKKIDDIGKGEDKTFLKIGDYSFGAVKYALMDHKSRVFTETQNYNHGLIKSIMFTGGKMEGITVNFSPELNTLIGIRGSGKSSILEAIRYSLDLSPSEVDQDYKKNLVKNVLCSGGQVTMHITDRYGKNYEIRRIFDETPSVLDEMGNDLPIPVHALINNPLYFGQKDLSFTQPGYELNLLQKLVGGQTDSNKAKIASYISELSEKIKELLDVSVIPTQIKDLEDKNSELKHKLLIFGEKGVAEKLKKQTSCNSDKFKLEGVSEQVKSIVAGLKKELQEVKYDDLALDTHISEFNPEKLGKANTITKDIIGILKCIKDSIKLLENKQSELNGVCSDLSQDIDLLKEEFAQIKREIQDDTLDLESFVQYTADQEKNSKRIGELKKVADSQSELITQIKRIIRERNETLRNIFMAYQAEIEKINLSQSELKIEISFKGNKELFKEALKDNFKGSSVSENKYQQISEHYSDFVALLEDYFLEDGAVLRTFLTVSEYQKISAKIEENYKKLIGIECPNLVKIFYHGKLLEHHSIGQRASALILFILTQKENDVIIIDQPEDDLDNQVIYKEVIHTIKDKKPYIQFIFATHNANIPVLGDAEQIIATMYTDENKISVDVGNIDRPETHKEIVDIMEGGKEAFEKRKLIYTAWDN